MKAESKEFDAVRLMREIREQLTRELAGMSFEERERYIRERVRIPEVSSASDRPNIALQRMRGRS